MTFYKFERSTTSLWTAILIIPGLKLLCNIEQRKCAFYTPLDHDDDRHNIEATRGTEIFRTMTLRSYLRSSDRAPIHCSKEIQGVTRRPFYQYCAILHSFLSTVYVVLHLIRKEKVALTRAKWLRWKWRKKYNQRWLVIHTNLTGLSSDIWPGLMKTKSKHLYNTPQPYSRRILIIHSLKYTERQQATKETPTSMPPITTPPIPQMMVPAQNDKKQRTSGMIPPYFDWPMLYLKRSFGSLPSEQRQVEYLQCKMYKFRCGGPGALH